MQIGLSLPPDYLANSRTRGSAARVWQSAFGRAAFSLKELHEAGVASIELRSISKDTDPDLAISAAHRVLDAELDLTIHGHLPGLILGDTFAELYPPLVPLVEALYECECESVMTLHCYSAAGANADELADRTVYALRKIVAIFQREDVPLRIALEINHIGARSDPGVTYEGILDIIARVDSSRIGACWDFGHAFMNVQHGQLERVPSTGFLRSVIHTHIHDLGPRTHSPLTCGVVPLGLFLDLLLGAGYSGILNLELSPERFQGPVKELVYASIDRLTDCVRRSSTAQNKGRIEGCQTEES
jgi:sugar phosphate isomerase/epimerase